MFRAPWMGLVALALRCVLQADGPMLYAQAIPLSTPNANLSEGFTAITSVRELQDGRVLLTDPRERRIVVADFEANTTRPDAWCSPQSPLPRCAAP